MKQYLMKEEKNLLKCLKENYNCTTICILQRLLESEENCGK